ncbi:MAG: FAD-binding oxidoreductase [Pseudomonadota bacterium]
MAATAPITGFDASDFAAIVGAVGVTTDAGELDYFSQDYFRKGVNALAVVAPRNADELSRVVAKATASGLAIFPRGGGYSYTDGYTPSQTGITLDLRSMNRVLKIDEHKMYVTVEPGCTWAELDKALAPFGLRTPFWGPFSGLNATVGGSVSQGTLSWGSGKYGVSSESVLDLEVVLADGQIVRTGASGQPNHHPFFRNYGPDLTGLFLSDCGALGVKSAITLRLIRRPERMIGLSFGFTSFDKAAEAAAEVARLGIAADNFGMPESKAIAAASQVSLGQDLKTLWKIGRTGSGVLDGMLRMAKVAAAGRRFLKDVEFSFHYVLEGVNQTQLNGYAQAVRQAVGSLGVEIANTVPIALRADPFLKYDMLSPTGQRQLPPSTILPLDGAIPFHKAFFEAIEPLRPDMEASNMAVTAALATVGTTGFLYEPVIAWDDAVDEFHRRHTSEAVLEGVADREPDVDARQLADAIRQVMIEKAFEHGGVHLQIGRVYPVLRERDPVGLGLLQDLKRRVDPLGLINPGALGL